MTSRATASFHMNRAATRAEVTPPHTSFPPTLPQIMVVDESFPVEVDAELPSLTLSL